MGRHTKKKGPDIPVHAVVHAQDGIDLFASDSERELYLELAKGASTKCGIETLGWGFLSTHGHFILVPAQEDSVSRFFHQVNKEYARETNRARGRKGHLFREPYFSCMMDEPHCLVCFGYVDLNPVKAGMTDDPAAYEWSSARFHLGLTDNDPLVTEKRPFGMDLDWHDLLTDRKRPEVDAIRRATRKRVPVGSRRFLESISKITGLRPESCVISETRRRLASD